MFEGNGVSEFEVGIDFSNKKALWVNNRFYDISIPVDNTGNATDGGGNLSY